MTDARLSRRQAAVAATALVTVTLATLAWQVLDDDPSGTPPTSRAPATAGPVSPGTTASSSPDQSDATATPADGPVVSELSVEPASVACGTQPVSLTLTWSASRATRVQLDTDGGSPVVLAELSGPDASAGSVPVLFACPADRHTYTLTATGSDGRHVQKAVVVKATEGTPS